MEHKISITSRISDCGRQEAKDRWMDEAVTKRADVPVPNEINRDPPVSRTPLRLSEIQRLPDGQSSRRSQPAWATTDRDRSHAIGDENEGNESRTHREEVRQHVCCARHERMIDVGYGISGEIIQIDAGHCRKLCPRHVLDDPGDASRPTVQRCFPESHCRPKASKLERVSTIQGVRVIEVTEACECTSDSSCRRESFTHLVHSGTPHQAVMDVGVCMGHCAKDLGCKPVRNSTVSIKGPNGDEVYQVIEKCGCAGTCHKMDHMETVLDFSEVEIKDGTNTTDVRPVVRQINVGQCVGTCPGNETEMCLLRDKREPSRCLAGLYSKQHTCTPARFKVHEYRYLVIVDDEDAIIPFLSRVPYSMLHYSVNSSECQFLDRIQRRDVVQSRLVFHFLAILLHSRIAREREMMMRDVRFLLLFATLFFFSSCFHVHAHPSRFTEDDNAGGRELVNSWPLDDLNEHDDARRNEILEKLQQVLGIRSYSEKTGRRKVPPQFMVELYNNVADPSGVTRGKNPYNAKVVRSFIERDTTTSRFYFFNITGLEVDESVLEAELHLYRKRTPLKALHPSILASPYYLIRVYQVLDEKSLDVPDLHRLLNVRYVGAHASGWQIFNVKQAVLAWLTGEPNLGLLVTASTLFEDQVNVEFSRRNEYHHSKQPILVLFDDDGKDHRGDGNSNEIEQAFHDDEDGTDDSRNEYNDGVEQDREGKGQLEETGWQSKNKSESFQRQKRTQIREYEGVAQTTRDAKRLVEEGSGGRRRRETMSLTKKLHGISSRDTMLRGGLITSMDIYERAMRRERMGERVGGRRSRSLLLNEKFREKRSTKSRASVRQNVTECSRHELYVDFKEIGLSSSIIAPLGYSAFHCKGICESPLSQDQQPTNHATIQGIVHKMGLVKGVERPCCVPTKLLGTTILFYDDNENVILKVYQDMIADRCGCR
ncbi:uncharacterized protein LOC100871171 [Apis florea]|uniref:uncharacterized protein LOC100871171 n=1 Tax=Apis florea TaxID=7463 RepID=UPI0012FE8885|nr:uncharacterized protein LOC100871171 [Apis florea]